MKCSLFFKLLLLRSLAVILCVSLGMPLYTVTPAMAAPGDTVQTLATPMELPVEVEIELAPAASLKQAPLWKELIQLLENPYATIQDPDFPGDPNARITTAPIVRRPGFGVTMPPLKVWSLGYNFLTAEPLRLRTSDGEVSWDQPGPLFDPDEVIATDQFNVPTALRTVIGELVACPAPGRPGNPCQNRPAGSLVVNNPPGQGVRNQLGFGGNGLGPGNSDSRIPPHRTVVAVRAVNAAGTQLLQLNGTSTTSTSPLPELEIPLNEVDFLRPATNTGLVPAQLRPYIGRRAAEVLGKALFWDMQVGSDGVQACGSCHFHAGADNRAKNQRNPNTNGPLGNAATLEALPASNTTAFNSEVLPGDFPFHDAGPDVTTTPNDVMSSMGVSRFKQFVDIPPIGGNDNPATPNIVEGSFGTPSVTGGVRPLARDIGNIVPDPVPVNEGFRRVEPRNTPTFHGAAFNFDNFWDGRARFHFNGGSVFGPSDPQGHIFVGGLLGALTAATNRTIRPDLYPPIPGPDPGDQPPRIKFSSLASQSVGPPLSNFEMSFDGRNWPKIGKKLLQSSLFQLIGFGDPIPGSQVVPLANQLVDPNDSVLGPFSGQRSTVGGAVNRPGRPGLNISYPALIRLAFAPRFWQNIGRHLNGSPALCTGTDANGFPVPAGCDPFDGYVLTIANGPASPTNTNQFTQMEANFSLFFGLSVQIYEQLTIPDDTPFDRFLDANPLAANGIGQPGEQAVLYPTLIPGLVGGSVTLVPGFGPDELFGFDIFAGGNLTAALAPGLSVDPASGVDRNPLIINSLGQQIRVGSNPFTRNARCMLCHLGPEQTDHSININHGLLKGDAEFEFPTPPFVTDPTSPPTFPDGLLPAPEPPGPIRVAPGLILAEEIAGAAQDAVEVEPRNFATFDDPATPWDDRIIAQPGFFAFGDQGIYNLGLRPIAEDRGRGGNDPFGWPLSLSAMALKNIGGPLFVPGTSMANYDPLNPGATFEETGEGLSFPGAPAHTLQSINPGFEKEPATPLLPAYLAPWANGLPAGELHPQIDELGFGPNVITPVNGGPAIEFTEVLFGADLHCGFYDPALYGSGPPNFGWGPNPVTFPNAVNKCPNNQSGVTGNLDYPLHGMWPVPNRVLRDGAFKAPSLRNVELTGPYFHTGSFLTLRQVVDFYIRGGDFPITNAASRDPHILNIEEQAFGFGRTNSINGDLARIFDCSPNPPNIPGIIPENCGPNFDFLVGTFADALPDTAFLYDVMPDTDHPLTPEPGTSRAAALEDVKNALVKFLLSLTDERVRFERAPFDRPELFVPIDGLAPENIGGQAQLVSLSTASTNPPTFVGNPLIDRTYATDFPAPPNENQVLVVVPSAVLPTGALQSFQTWNQATPGGSPTPSAGNQFNAYVLRPTGIANQYTVVFDSGLLTVPALVNPAVSEIATFPVACALVQAGDVIGFYGEGVPVDIVASGTDILSFPAPTPPVQGQTITLGADPGFPIFPQARTYSIAANVNTPDALGNLTAGCFRRLPAVGAAGNATPLAAFLGVTNVPPGQPGFNCDPTLGAISHFCQ